MKIVKSDDEEILQLAIDEYLLIKDVRHPHIVRMTDMYKCFKSVYLVMERAEGVTLKEYFEVQKQSLSLDLQKDFMR